MSKLTTGGVNTLNIKPILTHPGQNRRTSITSFEDMLAMNHSQDKVMTGQEMAVNEAMKNNNLDPGVTEMLEVNEDLTKQADSSTDAKNTENTSSATTETAKKSSTTKTYESQKSSATSVTTADSMKKTKYDSIFKKAAKRYGVSESLLKAIAKAESNFNPNDTSSSGAMGVMQLMPETAKSLGVKNAYDPEENIMAGAKLIKQKLKEFNFDVKTALAAYNAGSGAVKRAGGIPSRCQTYIKKVLSYKEAYETADKV